MRSALIIVDVQNDFALPNGALSVPGGDAIAQKIVTLIKEKQSWDLVVATRDWHGEDHTSFAKNHGLPDYSEFEYVSPVEGQSDVRQMATLWPVHCVQNTSGSELADPLNKFVATNSDIPVIDKGYLSDREYYSAFNDIWQDHHTKLNDVLKDNEIQEVQVVGLALDYCVKATAISAAQLGYKTTILKDFCKAIDSSPEAMQKLEAELKSSNVALL